MDYNKNIRNTWIMVAVVTAVAYIISGIIELSSDQNIWIPIMRFSSALLLIINAVMIKQRMCQIFKNPAPYVIIFFLGYTLSLVGLMTELRISLWSLGTACLVFTAIISLKKVTE